MADEKLATGTTTTDKLIFELDLALEGASVASTTRTLTFNDPSFTVQGVSAITDFKEFLLQDQTAAAYPAIVPNRFFQASDWKYGGEGEYVSAVHQIVGVTAKRVQTTQTVTEY